MTRRLKEEVKLIVYCDELEKIVEQLKLVESCWYGGGI
jgi:hypothetical protein